MKKEISFNDLPDAVSHLTEQVEQIKQLLIEKTEENVTSERELITIDEVCKLTKKAKSTIYALVEKRSIPCYKKGKRLYFYKDEVVSWIESGRKKTIVELLNQAEDKNHGK